MVCGSMVHAHGHGHVRGAWAWAWAYVWAWAWASLCTTVDESSSSTETSVESCAFRTLLSKCCTKCTADGKKCDGWQFGELCDDPDPGPSYCNPKQHQWCPSTGAGRPTKCPQCGRDRCKCPSPTKCKLPTHCKLIMIHISDDRIQRETWNIKSLTYDQF